MMKKTTKGRDPSVMTAVTTRGSPERRGPVEEGPVPPPIVPSLHLQREGHQLTKGGLKYQLKVYNGPLCVVVLCVYYCVDYN